MKIKVHKNNQNDIYVINAEDSEKLKIIIKQYDIKVPIKYQPDGRLLFWQFELDEIEKQWKLARKKERAVYYG